MPLAPAISCSVSMASTAIRAASEQLRRQRSLSSIGGITLAAAKRWPSRQSLWMIVRAASIFDPATPTLSCTVWKSRMRTPV